MATVKLPHDKPMSSLDGYSMVGIDTDPDTNVGMCIVNAALNGLTVISVVPVVFHGSTPGWIVTLYDRTEDPRAWPTEPKQSAQEDA